MKPTQYEDETICYKCMFEFAGWDNLGSPWEEHLSQNPNCPFITESDPNNVDLSSNAHGHVHFNSLSSFAECTKLCQGCRIRAQCEYLRFIRNSLYPGRYQNCIFRI